MTGEIFSFLFHIFSLQHHFPSLKITFSDTLSLFPLEAVKEVEQGTLSLSASSMDYDYDEYVKKILEKQRSIFGTADKRINESQEKQKVFRVLHDQTL